MKSVIKLILLALLVVLVCSYPQGRMQRNRRPNFQKNQHQQNNHQQQMHHNNVPHNNAQTGMRNRLRQRVGLNSQQEEGVETTTEPVETVTEPVETVTEPVETTASEPVEGASEPVEGASEPVEGASEPVEGASEPVEGDSEPVEGASEPVEGASEPVEGASESVEQDPETEVDAPAGEVEQLTVEDILNGNTGEEEEEDLIIDADKVYLYGYEDLDSGAWLEEYCVNNDRPSPVNFEVNAEATGVCSESYSADVVTTEGTQTTWFENRDHSLVAQGNWDTLEVLVNGQSVKYAATQFEFHSPSEHTVNEQQFDLEMQIRHEILEEYEGQGFDRYAVVAYFFNESDTQTEELKEFLETFHPDQEFTCRAGFDCDSIEKQINTDFSQFQEIFTLDNYYYYQGSLTVPPCTPNVSWFVKPEPLGIFYKWMKEFKAYWPQNARFSNNVRNNGHFFDEWIGNNRPVQRSLAPEFYENCGTVVTIVEEIAPETFGDGSEGEAPGQNVTVEEGSQPQQSSEGDNEEWVVTDDEVISSESSESSEAQSSESSEAQSSESSEAQSSESSEAQSGESSEAQSSESSEAQSSESSEAQSSESSEAQSSESSEAQSSESSEAQSSESSEAQSSESSEAQSSESSEAQSSESSEAQSSESSEAQSSESSEAQSSESSEAQSSESSEAQSSESSEAQSSESSEVQSSEQQSTEQSFIEQPVVVENDEEVWV